MVKIASVLVIRIMTRVFQVLGGEIKEGFPSIHDINKQRYV